MLLQFFQLLFLSLPGLRGEILEGLKRIAKEGKLVITIPANKKCVY